MTLEGTRSRRGTGALLVGLSLYAVLMAHLLRLPCRVPAWDARERLPALCAAGTAPAPPTAPASGAVGGFFTGGPAGDQPALAGMISTVVGRVAAGISALPGTGTEQDVAADLSLALLALVWIATVGVVAALSGRRRTDAFVLALAPVVVLVGFTTWDLWAVLLMLLAVLFHVRGSPAPAGVCLGLGASVALFPLVVLLAALFLAVRHRAFRDFLVLLLGAVLTWLLVNGPFMVAAGERWVQQVGGALDRPLAGSSLWGLWDRAGRAGSDAVPDPARAGEHVVLALVLGFVAVLVVVLLTRREPSVVQVAFLLLAVLVLFAGASAPVSALWLAPLVLLSRRNWPEFAVWQLVEALHWTTLVLPGPAWPVLPWIGLVGWDTQDLLAALRLLLLVYFVVVVTVDVLRGRRAMQTGTAGPG